MPDYTQMYQGPGVLGRFMNSMLAGRAQRNNEYAQAANEAIQNQQLALQTRGQALQEERFGADEEYRKRQEKTEALQNELQEKYRRDALTQQAEQAQATIALQKWLDTEQGKRHKEDEENRLRTWMGDKGWSDYDIDHHLAVREALKTHGTDPTTGDLRYDWLPMAGNLNHQIERVPTQHTDGSDILAIPGGDARMAMPPPEPPAGAGVLGTPFGNAVTAPQAAIPQQGAQAQPAQQAPQAPQQPMMQGAPYAAPEALTIGARIADYMRQASPSEQRAEREQKTRDTAAADAHQAAQDAHWLINQQKYIAGKTTGYTLRQQKAAASTAESQAYEAKVRADSAIKSAAMALGLSQQQIDASKAAVRYQDHQIWMDTNGKPTIAQKRELLGIMGNEYTVAKQQANQGFAKIQQFDTQIAGLERKLGEYQAVAQTLPEIPVENKTYEVSSDGPQSAQAIRSKIGTFTFQIEAKKREKQAAVDSYFRIQQNAQQARHFYEEYTKSIGKTLGITP